MERRQNLLLGIFVAIMTLVFVFLGLYSNSGVDKYQTKLHKAEIDGLLDKKLRGGDGGERSIWVSQESQPFVSCAGDVDPTRTLSVMW